MAPHFRSSVVALITALLAFCFTAGSIAADAGDTAAIAAAVEVLDSDNNYFLKVDLQDSRVQIRVGLANNDSGGYQTLGSQVGRYAGQGYATWAAINADYFGGGCPSGANCAQGLTYLSGARKDNWSQYGNTWQVRGNIGSDSARSVDGAIGDAQGKRNMVVAGGPWIVRGGGSPQCNPTASGGKAFFAATGEWFDSYNEAVGWCTTTGPLTAVGYSGDRKYLFMGISRGGKTIVQLAQWLKDRGASDVLKLDGGGSTGMYYNGSAVYFSSRAIANHLAVVVSSGGSNPPPPPAGWAYQIFSLGDYNGEKYESSQTYTDLSAIGKNDWAESLKINTGYGILACSDSDFRGSCGRATGPAQFSDINALAQGLRRGLSSIKVCSGACTDNPQPAGWAYQIFSLGDYNGEKYESNQTITNLQAIGKNDWAQSMKINSGYEVIACSDSDFHGSCGRATGPAQFSDINALAQGLRNGLSSLRVCAGACPRPPSQPAPRSPANGATLPRGATVILDWDASANTTEYAAEFWGPTGQHSSGRRRESDWDLGQLPEGAYHWHVEAYNSEGGSGWTAEWTFTVAPPPPSAQFDAWPVSGRAPLTARFHIISAANITGCQWDYGDNSTGTSCEAYHDHTYATPGSYTVRLTASGAGGSDTQARTGYITVEGEPPTAEFAASPVNGQAPLAVRFHNTSHGNITACLWEYGDGSTGNACGTDHDHSYASAGSYTVRLTVNGPDGSNTQSRANYITVSAPPSAADCGAGEGVVLYENANYGGRCTRFMANDDNLTNDPIGADTASSIRIFGNYQAVVFENTGFTGASSRFTADDPDFANDAIAHDRASAIQVSRRDTGGTTNCNGGPGAYLYEQVNYEGRCSKFTSDSPDPQDWFLGNDAASSIRFVGDYQATIFENANYGGANSTFTAADPDFGNDAIGQDRTSSIQVRQRSAPGGSSNCDGSSGVYLYENANYQGRCSKFTADARTPGDWYVGNDTASSIRLIGNYEATVYEHDDYQGVNSAFSGDDPDFGNDAIGHDKVSSVRVQLRSTGPSSCPAGKFLGEYFANPSLTGSPVFRRCEDNINYNWRYGAPGNGVGADNFSVRWSGSFWFASAAPYRFITRTDDGVRLWIDDQRVIDAWHDMAATEFTIARQLSAGAHRLSLEYYEKSGQAVARLAWNRQADAPADSDDGRQIAFAQSLDGTVNPAGDRDDYNFVGTAGQAITIRLDKRNSTLDAFVELYNPDGSLLGRDDDGGGNQNARLAITLGQNGRYKIIARDYGTATGGYRLSLNRESVTDPDDGRWLTFGVSVPGIISPADDRDGYYFSGTAGRSVNIRMTRRDGNLDSFLELYNPAGVKVAENDDGGGERNAWIVYSLPTSGTYRVMARSYNLGSTGGYTVAATSISNRNLALERPAVASSVAFTGAEALKATDGNTATRWTSRPTDLQWIYVDLGQDRTFNQVVLKWAAAYGQRFGIYYQSSSMCAACWTNVYWTNNGRGGTNTLDFNSVRARYVLLYGATRGDTGGYALGEFEIYDNSSLVLPLVPPDPGDKTPEAVEQIAPLAPNDEGKETLLIGEGDTGQEEMPLASADPLAAEAEAQENRPTATILYPNEAAPAEEEILFQGVAADTDDDGRAIVEYRWTSNIDGQIGAVDTFVLSATALTAGSHIITFQVLDDEGNWSAPVSTTLEVTRPRSYYYLPLVPRGQ